MTTTSTVNDTTPATTLRELKQIVIDITKARLTPNDISDTANLFDECGLDSSSIVELVLAIEEKFGVVMSEDQLQVELFQDISRLAAFIDELKGVRYGETSAQS